LTVSNSVASLNSNSGIYADFSGTVRASNNTVTRNGTGFVQGSTGVFRSRGNNTVDGNTTETSGTITSFGPI
jgi:parallel beta-helix repeat protein